MVDKISTNKGGFFSAGDWSSNKYNEASHTTLSRHHTVFWVVGVQIQSTMHSSGCVSSAAVAHTHACPPPRHAHALMGMYPTPPYHASCPPAMHAPTPCHTCPTPLNRISDRCKNITFPQLLLRTVKRSPCIFPQVTFSTHHKINRIAPTSHRCIIITQLDIPPSNNLYWNTTV